MRYKKRDIVILLIKLTVAAVLFVFAVSNYDALSNVDVRALVDGASSIAGACAAILGVYFIKGLVFIVPASLIYTSVGMAMDTAVAVAVNLCGIALEVSVTYVLGRILGGEYVEGLLQKSKGGRKLLGMKNKNRYSALAVIRFLPVFPIDFASLFLGSGKLPFVPYFLISVLCIAPRVIAFTILGDGLYDYIPMDLLVKLAVGSIPVFAVFYLVKWIKTAKN